jgi:hypothetical protein
MGLIELGIFLCTSNLTMHSSSALSFFLDDDLIVWDSGDVEVRVCHWPGRKPESGDVWPLDHMSDARVDMGRR